MNTPQRTQDEKRPADDKASSKKAATKGELFKSASRDAVKDDVLPPAVAAKDDKVAATASATTKEDKTSAAAKDDKDKTAASKDDKGESTWCER
jgi:hypothetical protein